MGRKVKARPGDRRAACFGSLHSGCPRQRGRGIRAVSELRTTLRNLELEAKSNDARIKEIQDRLYGGRLTNPKELEGFEKEVEMLKRQRSRLDDQLLELMEAADLAQARADSSAAAVRQAEGLRAGDIELLSKEREVLAVRLSDLAAERDDIRVGLDPAYLRVYDRLRTKTGRALATLRKDACSACGVAIPTGMVQRGASRRRICLLFRLRENSCELTHRENHSIHRRRGAGNPGPAAIGIVLRDDSGHELEAIGDVIGKARTMRQSTVPCCAVSSSRPFIARIARGFYGQ